MSNTLIINVDQGAHKISRHIYGHFAEYLGRCIYEGFWVGEDSDIPNTRGIRNDVVEALRKLKIPNLRWPGGCFADEYHWMDGIGERESRPSIVNTHWGNVVENNHFGTHEFFDLCEMLETEPYICGNVGSGTVQEMAQWVEYCTHPGGSPMSDLRKQNGREEPWKLPYFGVGNESWGCGGNMRPEYYADVYRRYQTYVRPFGENKAYRIACGANDQDYEWTEVLMRRAGGHMDGLSLHYYTIPNDSWEHKGSATNFNDDEWFITLKKCLKLEELLARHGAIMDRYDPQKRVGLIVDEWGTWFDVEPGTNPGFLYQQNTLRDALVAGLSLNIFNAHADRVYMANIAQTVNVLQAMILTDGAKMILTPTYHVFEMWKAHQDAQLLSHHLSSAEYSSGEQVIPALNASASTRDGKIHLTLCHADPTQSAQLSIELRGANVRSVVGKVLSAEKINAHNTFENPNALAPRDLEPEEIRMNENRLMVILPPACVALIQVSA